MKNNTALLLVLLLTIALHQYAAAQAAAGSLPVVLVDFNARCTPENKIALSWTCQQEVNADYYSIEKSTDALAWKPIGTVKAVGNSAVPVSYSSEDAFPLKGTNYYRICVRNLSGLTGYTVVKVVRMNTSAKVCVYPNPSTNFVNIALPALPQNDWTVRLINNSGRVMIIKKYNLQFTNVNLSVQNYPNGNYIVESSDGVTTYSNRIMIIHP